MQVIPSGKILGATVAGIDLGRQLEDAAFAQILQALAEHGVLCFPAQTLTSAQLRDFSARFGPIQRSVTGKLADPEVPEVGILSNIVENGQPIGLADAGQDWHTDMSYNATIGFLNVLYAVKVPVRDGRVLGATLFANMRAAYEDLEPALKERLEGMTATHDFN
jgi:taurine dioxygenase